MTRRAAFRQSDVTRLVKGALKAGLPVGSFVISVENGRPTLLPVRQAADLSSDQKAEDEWDKALGLR